MLPTNQSLQEFLDEPEMMHEVAEALRRAIADDSIAELLAAPAEDEDDKK